MSPLRKSRLVTYGLALIFSVGGAYFLVQGIILSNSGPTEIVKEYSNAISSRNGRAIYDEKLFPQSGRSGSLATFYSNWPAIDGKTWRTSVDWKTSSNLATMSLEFEGTNLDPILVELKADQFTKYGLFRAYENWRIVSYAPVLYIDTRNLQADDELYINGNSYGDVRSFEIGNPLGTLVVLPGPYIIGLGENGNIRSSRTLWCFPKQTCSFS